jgi:hypothetical protein
MLNTDTTNNLATKDVVTLIIAALALLVSAATFFWSRYQEWSSNREAMIKALQGEKEAIAYVAYQITSGDKEFKNEKLRKKVVTALCLAFAMEGADRAKSLLFAAIKKLDGTEHEEIKKILPDISENMKIYQDKFNPNDFEKRVKAVDILMKELKIPPNRQILK